MIRIIKFIKPIILFLLLSGASCEEKAGSISDPITTGRVLKKIIYASPGVTWDKLNYSEDGKLMKYENFIGESALQWKDYYYKNSQLDSVNFYVLRKSTSGILVPIRSVVGKYTFDSEGRLVKFEENDIFRKNNYDFYYKADKLDSVLYCNIDYMYPGTNLYSYKIETDSFGNITGIKQYQISPEYSEKFTPLNYKYDDKKNPLYMLTNPRWFTTFFSKSNVIEDESGTYSYDYNSFGLPVKKFQKSVDSLDNINLKLTFDYFYSDK